VFRLAFDERSTDNQCVRVLNSPVFTGLFHFKFSFVLTLLSEDSVFLGLYPKTLLVLEVFFISKYTLQ